MSLTSSLLEAELLVHSVGGLMVLLFVTVLSVYKPWGLTAYGRRKQSERRLSQVAEPTLSHSDVRTKPPMMPPKGLRVGLTWWEFTLSDWLSCFLSCICMAVCEAINKATVTVEFHALSVAKIRSRGSGKQELNEIKLAYLLPQAKRSQFWFRK